MMLDILAVSHLCVTASYVAIPLQFVVALSKSKQRHDMPWRLILCLILFAWFFFLCGFAHLLLAFGKGETTLFYLTQCGNALVSTVTACYLVPLIPDMFSLVDQAVSKLTNETKESQSKLFTFMAFLCHEIRNPLFAITSSAECLQDTPLQPDQWEEVSSISDSSLLMLRLVNDVLDLSKLDSGKLELECVEFNVRSLIRRLGDNMARQAYRKHEGKVLLTTRLDPRLPRVIMGDSVRILQIVYNLLSNSVKRIDLIVEAIELDGQNGNSSKMDSEKMNDDSQAHTVKMSSDRPIAMFADEEPAKTTDHSSTSKTSCEDDGDSDTEDKDEEQVFSMALLGGDYGATETHNHRGESTNNGCNDIELGVSQQRQQEQSSGCSECDDDSCTGQDRTVFLSITVSDTGIGIPSERLKDIFEPYTQAKLSDFRQHGGTGLGLSIISSLTKTMGGTLSVTSKEGDGAKFHLTIPVKVPAHPSCLDEESNLSGSRRDSFLECQRMPVYDDDDATPADVILEPTQSPVSGLQVGLSPDDTISSMDPNNGSNNHRAQPQILSSQIDHLTHSRDLTSPQQGVPKTLFGTKPPPPPSISPFNLPPNDSLVLVVDDNSVNRKILGKMLTTFNVEHRMACNGQEAVDALVASRNNPKHADDGTRPLYGLVFMDVSMPVMDGNVAIQTIRQNHNIAVPIVALSANVLSQEQDKTICLGANEFKTKPILRKTLHSLCTKYLLLNHGIQEHGPTSAA